MVFLQIQIQIADPHTQHRPPSHRGWVMVMLTRFELLPPCPALSFFLSFPLSLNFIPTPFPSSFPFIYSFTSSFPCFFSSLHLTLCLPPAFLLILPQHLLNSSTLCCQTLHPITSHKPCHTAPYYSVP
jgi:hypothetical protein